MSVDGKLWFAFSPPAGFSLSVFVSILLYLSKDVKVAFALQVYVGVKKWHYKRILLYKLKGVGVGFDIFVWSTKGIFGMVFFLFVILKIWKKKASVKLKCNGVQFKCNTVNSNDNNNKNKTASSKSLLPKIPMNFLFLVLFHALLEFCCSSGICWKNQSGAIFFV